MYEVVDGIISLIAGVFIFFNKRFDEKFSKINKILGVILIIFGVYRFLLFLNYI